MNKLDEYMQKQYLAIVTPQEATDGTSLFLAYNPDLEGCMSDGQTPEEAVTNLQEARRLYIETLLEKGLEIPEPRGMSPTYTGGSATIAIWRTVTQSVQSSKEDTSFQKITAPSGVFSIP